MDPGRDGAAPDRGTWKRAAGAAVFFAIALLLLTGLGLLMTRRQAEGWVLVVRRSERQEPPKKGWERLPFGRLSEWLDATKEPPPAVAELDGARVEMYGLARPAGDAKGFWLVADALAVGEAWKPIIEKSVWVDFPERARPVRPIERGDLVRVRGVLRVGLTDVAGVGPAVFRLGAGEVWVREPGGRREHEGHEH